MNEAEQKKYNLLWLNFIYLIFANKAARCTALFHK